MSETCPHCEAPGRRDTYQVGDRHLSRWLCGASEHINGTILRSTECFENELGCVKEQLAAAQARIAELEAFARDIRDNFDCDSDAHYYETPCRYCMATQLLAATNSGPAAEGGESNP